MTVFCFLVVSFSGGIAAQQSGFLEATSQKAEVFFTQLREDPDGWEQDMGSRGVKASVEHISGNRYNARVEASGVSAEFSNIDPRWGSLPNLSVRRNYRGLKDFAWVESNDFAGQEYNASVVLPSTYNVVYRCERTQENPECFEIDSKSRAGGERPYYEEVNGSSFIYMNGFSGAAGADSSWSTQGEWNQGSFDGTSADRSDNSGNLGISYLNGSNSSATSLEDGLEGFWRMDGSSGGVVDYSGKGNTGTTRNFDGDERGVSGIFSTNSFEFDGVDDYVSISDDASVDVDNTMAMSVWFKLNEEINATEGFHESGLFSKEDAYGLWWQDADGGRMRFGTFGGNIKSSKQVWEKDKWYHVVAVKDGGDAYLYINGGLDNSGGLSDDITDSTSDLRIGQDEYEVGAGEEAWMDGKIDEVRLYDKAVSSGDVSSLYFSGSDGDFNGDYTTAKIDNGDETEWNKLNVDLINLPSGADVNAVFRALDSGGSVVDSEAFDLSSGDTNYSLSVSNSEDAEVFFKGNSTDVTKSWEIDRAAVYSSSAFCTPPISGDWMIQEKCDVTDNVSAPKNIIVNSTGVLNISTTQATADSSTVSSQSDWNTGIFDGATADKPSGLVSLSLGYLNGSNPSSTSLENGLRGYWRFDDVDSFSWQTIDDFDQYSSNTDFRSNYSEDEDMYDLTTAETAPGSSQAIEQTADYEDIGSNFNTYENFKTPPGYYYSAYVYMTDSTDGPGFTIESQDPKDPETNSYNIRTEIDSSLFSISGGGSNNEEAYTFSTNQWYRVEAKYTSATVEARLYEVSSDGSETQVAGPISVSTDSTLTDGGFGFYGSAAHPTYFDKVEKKPIGEVTDYSGNGNDGENRVTTTGVQGVFDTNAFDFDGSNDFVSIDSSYFRSTTTMTDKFSFSFWLNPDSDNDVQVITKQELGSDNSGTPRVEIDNGPIEFDSNNEEAVYSASDIAENTWQHVVIVFDGPNQEVNFYINGSLDASRSITYSSFSYSDPQLLIGRRGYANDLNYDGEMDEIRIYDRTLSSSEVEDLYLSGGDGAFNGNYESEMIESDKETSWDNIEVDASIPANTDASIEFEALDSSGSVVDSETHSLSDGLNNYSLSVSNSEDAKWIINGTSTDEEASWEVNDVTVYHGGDTGGSGVNLFADLQNHYLLVKAGGKVLLDSASSIEPYGGIQQVSWSTQSDWDSAQTRTAVVTRSIGDNSADTIELGYDPQHGVPSNFDHYWTFDESAESWADEVGNADLKNAAPLPTSPSETGLVADEPGVAADTSIWMNRDEIVEYNGMPIDPTGDWTLGWWTYYNQSMSGFRQGVVLDDDTGDDESVGIGTSDMDFKIGSVGRTPGTGQALSTDQWYFKVLKYDSSENTLYGYVDGSLDYSVTPDGSAWLGDLDVIRFGDREPGSDTGTIGRHDEGFLMQGTLSDSQISTLNKIRNSGNLTTAKKSVSGAPKQLETHAVIRTSTSITVTVHQDTNADGTSDNSEQISIGDGVNQYSLSNFDSTGSDVWLEIDLNTNDLETSPELNSASLS